eukprot:gene258-324_t
MIDSITYQMNNLGHEESNIMLAGPHALLKYQATRFSWQQADLAAQILGGRSITKTGLGTRIERFIRGNKYGAILGGSEEIMADFAVRMTSKKFLHPQARMSKQKMLIVTALLFGSCQALRMMNHVGSLEQGGQETLSYEVVQIAGQGMGTFAIRDIKYGETIFEERPVLTIENTDFVDYETATESELAHANNILQNQYDNLSTEDQNIIDEISG